MTVRCVDSAAIEVTRLGQRCKSGTTVSSGPFNKSMKSSLSSSDCWFGMLFVPNLIQPRTIPYNLGDFARYFLDLCTRKTVCICHFHPDILTAESPMTTFLNWDSMRGVWCGARFGGAPNTTGFLCWARKTARARQASCRVLGAKWAPNLLQGSSAWVEVLSMAQ